MNDVNVDARPRANAATISIARFSLVDVTPR
jgi:hypothetical protein